MSNISFLSDSAITYVDGLIKNAISNQVTDIHIEPYEKNCRIRFRRDGFLYEADTISPVFALQIITRIKIMGLLNIAEKRLPQDGRISFPYQATIDLRVSTCPTLFGEKVVLRILDNQQNLIITSLGLTLEQQTIFIGALIKPQGLILVTGPTGSGKTITLYAALSYLNKIERNIVSVEDPIEIQLDGINQISINSKIGFTFATALRALLRQDPDVMMIGEIRDQETANIAIQAAQTGHLVLATLHTNSAAETTTRLKSMQIETYNLINSISLIIAQRLLRKLCDNCKQLEYSYQLPLSQPHYKPGNCQDCCNGYAGRTGIFELINTTETKIELLLENKTFKPVQTLWEAGLIKVYEGTTSYAELTRVTGH